MSNWIPDIGSGAVGGAMAAMANRLEPTSFRDHVASQLKYHEAHVGRLRRMLELIDSNETVREYAEIARGQ